MNIAEATKIAVEKMNEIKSVLNLEQLGTAVDAALEKSNQLKALSEEINQSINLLIGTRK